MNSEQRAMFKSWQKTNNRDLHDIDRLSRLLFNSSSFSKALIRQWTLEAISLGDRFYLEEIMSLNAVFHQYQDNIDIFARASLLIWHRLHEDIVQSLAEHGSPDYLSTLYQVYDMDFPYQKRIDDGLELKRKCVYAIYKILKATISNYSEHFSESEFEIIAMTSERKLGDLTKSES